MIISYKGLEAIQRIGKQALAANQFKDDTAKASVDTCFLTRLGAI